MTDREQQYGSGTERPQKERRALHRRRLVRRKFLKLGAAGGAAMVASLYVSPSFRSIGALPAYAATPPPGGGCTPGYWKNHTNRWPLPYTPGMLFGTAFPGGSGAKYGSLAGMTLLGVLTQGGGCQKALGRHAVAALLNAATPGIGYKYTVGEVITLVNAALATETCGPPELPGTIEYVKDDLDYWNDQACPLGGMKACNLDNQDLCVG